MKRKYLKEGASGLNKPIGRPPKMNEEEFTNYEYIKEFSKDSKATVRIENYDAGNTITIVHIQIRIKFLQSIM